LGQSESPGFPVNNNEKVSVCKSSHIMPVGPATNHADVKKRLVLPPGWVRLCTHSRIKEPQGKHRHQYNWSLLLYLQYAPNKATGEWSCIDNHGSSIRISTSRPESGALKPPGFLF
jgi:hypothetical protein